METKFKILYKRFHLLNLIVSIIKKLRNKKLSKSDRAWLNSYLEKYWGIYNYYDEFII